MSTPSEPIDVKELVFAYDDGRMREETGNKEHLVLIGAHSVEPEHPLVLAEIEVILN